MRGDYRFQCIIRCKGYVFALLFYKRISEPRKTSVAFPFCETDTATQVIKRIKVQASRRYVLSTLFEVPLLHLIILRKGDFCAWDSSRLPG